MTAGQFLGPAHPLTRASQRFETACLQALSGLVLPSTMKSPTGALLHKLLRKATSEVSMDEREV
jgi:hypothetical protein